MAGKTEDLQIPLSIVAAKKYRQPVMHLKHAFGGRRAADFAGAASGRDQRPATGRRQRSGSGPPVVGGEKASSGAAISDQWHKFALVSGGTVAAEDDQAGGGAAATFIDLEYVKGPTPFEPAALAGPRAPALKRNSNARSNPQSAKHAFAQQIVVLIDERGRA